MTPYYADDLVTIYHGDSRDILPSIAADVLVTDPPYGVNLGDHAGASDDRHVLRKARYATYEDTPENFLEIVVPLVSVGLAMTRRGAVFCPPSRVWDLPRATAIGGVFLPSAMGRSGWGYTSLVLCLLYGNAPDLHLGAKATAIRSVPTRAEGDGHPVAKPIAWMRWLVGLTSRGDEVIVDPFLGSGTTLVAAKDLGRRAVGIEIEESYCEIAANRCSQEVLGLSA
jgi:DNA modification methylase